MSTNDFEIAPICGFKILSKMIKLVITFIWNCGTITLLKIQTKWIQMIPKQHLTADLRYLQKWWN